MKRFLFLHCVLLLSARAKIPTSCVVIKARQVCHFWDVKLIMNASKKKNEFCGDFMNELQPSNPPRCPPGSRDLAGTHLSVTWVKRDSNRFGFDFRTGFWGRVKRDIHVTSRYWAAVYKRRGSSSFYSASVSRFSPNSFSRSPSPPLPPPLELRSGTSGGLEEDPRLHVSTCGAAWLQPRVRTESFSGVWAAPTAATNPAVVEIPPHGLTESWKKHKNFIVWAARRGAAGAARVPRMVRGRSCPPLSSGQTRCSCGCYSSCGGVPFSFVLTHGGDDGPLTVFYG